MLALKYFEFKGNTSVVQFLERIKIKSDFILHEDKEKSQINEHSVYFKGSFTLR